MNMPSKYRTRTAVDQDPWEESAPKRMRHNGPGTEDFESVTSGAAIAMHDNQHKSDPVKDKSISIASTAKMAPQAVAPFLAKHIPKQYAPLDSARKHEGAMKQMQGPNSKYCYRHRPDMLCRKQADEPSMAQLQNEVDSLPEDDRRGITYVWSLFSAAPSKHRDLMLQGILTQCCFPQLSFLSASVHKLIKIDFISALPSEVAFKILCYLDTTSLCKAAQVSRRWRQLADDDVVWHRMCEQHIDRKCTKCGWGLPLLDRKLLRASKRRIQLRATGRGLNEWSPDITPVAEKSAEEIEADMIDASRSEEKSCTKRPPPHTTNSELFRKTRPWKDVYRDRFRVGTNWKYGRCSVNVLRGHSNGVMAVQMYDNILATGSYDATIKIWDMESGEELQTLRGHTMGIRCLQFDDTKLISGSLDTTLKVWNWRTGQCLTTNTGHTDGIIAVHFDGNLVCSGSIDKTARVWNYLDKSVYTLRGHTDWVNSVRIDSASRTIFTASDDCTVKLWDLDTKKCIRTYEGHVGQVQQVLPLASDFETDTSADTSEPGSPSGSSTVSQRQSISPVLTYSNLQAASLPEDCSRPNLPRYMLTSALDSTIRLWEVHTGRCIRTFFGHVEGIWALAADTLRIVSGAEDRMVKVWDPRTGKCERTFTGHAGPVTCIALSDSRMCSGGEDGEVRVYNFTT